MADKIEPIVKRAFKLAEEQKHQYVTIEHLLFCLIDDKDSLLEIPEFLKRKPRNRVSKTYKPKSIKQKWWMPNLVLYKKQREDRELRKKEIIQEKVLKKKRKQKKLTIEYSLLDIISRGHNTFGKIRNYFKCIEIRFIL